MYINENFKNNILEQGRQISVKMRYDDMILETKQIISCKKTFKGDMFKSVMQYVDVEIQGNHNLLGKEIHIEFGVKYDTDTYEYIHYGSYIVDNESVQYSIDTDSTQFTGYDYLYKSHVGYDLNIVYPITVKEFVKLICIRLDYQLITDTFINSDNLIMEEKYLDTYQVTFRDVLDDVAGCTGGIICIDSNNLYIKYPTETGYIIDEHNLKSLTLNDRYGPINSLVLSLQPQNDDYYRQNLISIVENGKTEIKISNNEIMNKNRELFIDDLFNYLEGFYFYPFSLDSFGFGYFNPYDIVTIKNLEGVEHKCLILSNAVEITTGMKESINCNIPTTNETDYSKATKDKKILYNTLLTVDKQNKTIDAIVKQEEENTEQISNLKISVDGIQTEVKKTSESIYKFESGSGNIFENCNQYISKSKEDEGEVISNNMPLGINKDFMRGKDICIAVDVKVINAQLNNALGNYVGAEFQVGYADGTKKTYQTRWYLGQFILQYSLTTSTNDCDKRIYTHCKIEDKEIMSVSNLKMVISLDADKTVVSYAKVEFGEYPTGYQFDVPYVRDNVVTLQKDYTLIKQEVSSLSLQAISMEEQVTTIKGDVETVETRLQSTELKLTPTSITAMVNEKIGTDGQLKTVKVTIDKNGLDVKNGAISITNNEGAKVLYADVNGNLVSNKITINDLQSTSGKIGKFNIDDKGFSYIESVNIESIPCTFTLDIHPSAKDSFMNWKLETNDGVADDITGALTYSGLSCTSVCAMFVDTTEVNTFSINGDTLRIEDSAYIGYVDITNNLRVNGTTNLYDVRISGNGYINNSNGKAVSMQRIADLVR